MKSFDETLMSFLDNPINILGAALGLLGLVVLVLYGGKVLFYLKFISKSLFRNLLRTILTGMATLVLVFVVTLVWTVLNFLDLVTTQKTNDFKAIITERWQIPSQMPMAYALDLSEGAPSKKEDIHVAPEDSMTWQFYGGTLDPTKMTRENLVFFFGMEPSKLTTMMDDLDTLTGKELADLQAACKEMEKDKRKVVVGRERLKSINKRVGERFKLTGTNYKGIDLEFEIIGVLPNGRYNLSAVMNRAYLNNALEDYERKNGAKHFMADKTLNLVWLKVPDTNAFRQVSDQIMTSPKFLTPAVKCETASSGVSAFLDAYRDLLWGMRWVLVPAILVTMALVIANAISISVRERRTEMAVLKVLGFGPRQILILVLGEAMVIGIGAGMISTWGTYFLVNMVLGGVPFPIAFFPVFRIPEAALWWGPTVGGLTALAGSLVPSWSAQSVKVSEVFSKIS
jgi:putative ABC transport system permease protein